MKNFLLAGAVCVGVFVLALFALHGLIYLYFEMLAL